MYASIDGGSTKMNNKKLHNEFADSSALAFPVGIARALCNMGLREFLLLNQEGYNHTKYFTSTIISFYGHSLRYRFLLLFIEGTS
ncbi:hypothetical protein [Lysinibacillus sp. 3P01SB]|uniref:hypothetical protein n=1 Tax=Lysinibacillus sp. 3P01SB TaxID=3132284 RepID=UPI0039A4FDA3